MKLKVAHMDAGGRKWCAQRQQSLIMQMLGNKLPVKHKKEAIFQSLRCLGEKIRTSGLLNPIQARYQTALHPVMFQRSRLSPKGSTLRTKLIIACFQRPVKRENVFFYDFFAKSNAKNHKHDALCRLAPFRRFFHEFVKILDDFLRVVAFFCVIPDLLEKLIETLICHVQCHISVK